MIWHKPYEGRRQYVAMSLDSNGGQSGGHCEVDKYSRAQQRSRLHNQNPLTEVPCDCLITTIIGSIPSAIRNFLQALYQERTPVTADWRARLRLRANAPGGQPNRLRKAVLNALAAS